MVSLLAALLMTRANLGPKLAKAGAWALLIVLALFVLAVGKCTYDRSVVEKHSAKVETADVKADAKAIATAETEKETIDATNQRAADAAAKSDDPLAAGFSELRAKGAGGSGKAPR